MTSIRASLNLTWYVENKLIAADNNTDNIMDDIFYKFNALGSQVSRNECPANVVYFQDGTPTPVGNGMKV